MIRFLHGQIRHYNLCFPAPVAKVAGRYICLIEGESGDPETYLADDSLVNLARELGDKVGDWAFVENALIENGVFRLSDVL